MTTTHTNKNPADQSGVVECLAVSAVQHKSHNTQGDYAMSEEANATPAEAEYDELAHIETMNAEELRTELRSAVKFHRECLVENWHEKKQIRAENKELESSIKKSIDTLKKSAVALDNMLCDLKMWRRSAYALAFLVVVLALKVIAA